MGASRVWPSSTTPAFEFQSLPGLNRMRAPLHPPEWSVFRHVCAQLYANVTRSGFQPICSSSLYNVLLIRACTSKRSAISSGGGGRGCWKGWGGGRKKLRFVVGRQRLYPTSWVVTLNHTLDHVSLNACMSCANFSTQILKPESVMNEISVVSIMMGCVSSLLSGKSGNGLTARGPSALLMLDETPHWVRPPCPSSEIHSKLIKFWKYSLSQRVGCVVHGPSNPELYSSSPMPVPHFPFHGLAGLMLGGSPPPSTQAPWAFPKACPPPTSATVSSSLKPLTVKVMRTSEEVFTGLAVPFTPSASVQMLPRNCGSSRGSTPG
mmetsp:Transcript_20654/g.34541  ORF Transcript_20654/g.34541 Transcript_20654/m.34541 type:complete len:321 (+) Transcript_20654:1376-2338(+)